MRMVRPASRTASPAVPPGLSRGGDAERLLLLWRSMSQGFGLCDTFGQGWVFFRRVFRFSLAQGLECFEQRQHPGGRVARLCRQFLSAQITVKFLLFAIAGGKFLQF